MFVTLELARKHLRVDDEDDELLEQYVAAAQQSAVDYLNRSVFKTQEDLDTAVAAGRAGQSPIVVNAAIRAAILLIAGDLYKQRETIVMGATSVSELSIASNLLWPHRLNNGV